MKLQPRSSARFSAATDSDSSCGPHPPPIAQAPKPIPDTFQPVPPNVRYRMRPMISSVLVVHLNFTDTLTKTIANAQLEARRLNQDFIGTEHLALALLDQDDSEAGRILAQMNVQAGYVR